MRILRWLAIALVVIAAPAVFFFLSNLYFLASPEPNERKQRLIESTYIAMYHREFGGGWLDLFPTSPRAQPVVSVAAPAPAVPHPSVWQEMKACPGYRYPVKVDLLDDADGRDFEYAIDAIENLPLRHAINLTRMHGAKMQAQSFSVWGLAALDACVRATPFHAKCGQEISDQYPSDTVLVQRLIDARILGQEDGKACWKQPLLSVENSPS